MRFWTVAIFVPAFALLISGCSSTSGSRKPSAPPSDEQEHKVPLSRYERTFNPSDFDDEIDLVQKQHELEQQRAAATHQHDSVVVEAEFTQGFRIQIYATGNIDEANAMRTTAAQRIPEDSVYVVFDPPVYKVRVGDFKTKAEASQRLLVVSGLGFTDAWVVGDRIIQRRLVKVPPANSIRKQ